MGDEIMIMDAKEFVKKVVELVNKHQIPSEKEFIYEILIPESKHQNKPVVDNFLVDLYNNFILSGRVIGFSFNNKLIESNNFIFFASQDPFDIGIDKATGEIIMYDGEYEKIHLKLSKSMDEFLELTLLIFDYGLSGWIEDKKYTESDRKELFRLIKSKVDEDYLEYYRQSYNN